MINDHGREAIRRARVAARVTVENKQVNGVTTVKKARAYRVTEWPGASVNWQNKFRVFGSFRWFLSFRKPKPENGYYVYNY
jgi:hypothetical protein